MINRFEALKSLRPGAEFIVVDNDFSTIKCLTDDVVIPTIAEIDAEVERLINIEEEKPIKKAAAEAKLAALGLTADDLKALGLG